MQCSTHSEIAAAGTCTYSGKPFCKDCLIEVEGRSVGKHYLDKAVADIRDRASSKSQPNVYMNAGGGAAGAAASAEPSVTTYVEGGEKSKSTAYLLLLLGGFWINGLQRFYLRQYVTGTIYLLTFGLLWVGTIYDLFVIGSRVDMYNALHRRTASI